jgi:hypothetical protein
MRPWAAFLVSLVAIVGGTNARSADLLEFKCQPPVPRAVPLQIVCIDRTPKGSEPAKGNDGSETQTFSMNNRAYPGTTNLENVVITYSGSVSSVWFYNPTLTLVTYKSGRRGLKTRFSLSVDSVYLKQRSNTEVDAMLLDKYGNSLSGFTKLGESASWVGMDAEGTHRRTLSLET